MSDRCYMEITCRKQDQKRFAALGFTAQDWKQHRAGLVVMVDEEAAYAHSGHLPTDVPYHGFNASGGNFGQGAMVCDGKTQAEVETGHGGGFVVDWDEKLNRPSLRSLKSIRRYLKIRNRVLGMFEFQANPTSEPPSARPPMRRRPHKPQPPLTTHPPSHRPH